MPILPTTSPYGGLLRALGLSVLLHFLLLWPVAVWWRDAMPAATISARLRPALPTSAPALPTPAMVPKAVQDASAEQNAKSRPPPPLSTPAHEAPLPPPDIPSTTASADSSTSLRSTATQTAQATTAGLDAEGVRAYRIALARGMIAGHRYPSAALAARQEGTVELQVTVVRGLAEVSVLKSSGHGELDAAALAMLTPVVGRTTLPASLRERDFSVSVPVLFELPQ